MDRILDADAERQEQPIYQGFAVKGLPRLTGLPLEACLYVDRLEAGRAPELSVCASADYTHLKRQQLAVAAALRRCRHHKAGLSALVSSSAAALAEEDKKSQAHWEWAEPALLLCRLPPLSLQDALLEQNALGAAVRALQPAADGFDTSHSWRGLGSAVEEAQLAECTVLLSRTHTRATPDAAGWRGWVVHVRHEAWRREAAVCVCLRKFAPPHGGEFSRLLCGATAEAVANAGAGGAGAGESQLVTEVEAAMERWRPPAGAGYQRAKLHSACEQLTWTREAARHFQVRPACAPLLRQAVQAAEELCLHALSPHRDADAHATTAAAKIAEVLSRAAAMLPPDPLLRHRLSYALANELPLERLLAVEADERCGHGARRLLAALIEYVLGLLPIASILDAERPPLPRAPGEGLSLSAHLATLASLEAAGQRVRLFDLAEAARGGIGGEKRGVPSPHAPTLDYCCNVEVLLLLAPSGYLQRATTNARRPALHAGFLQLLLEQPARRPDADVAVCLQRLVLAPEEEAARRNHGHAFLGASHLAAAGKRLVASAMRDVRGLPMGDRL